MNLYLNLTSNDLLIKTLMVISLIFSYTLSTTKNPIYSALSLIVVLVSTSIILWFIGAEFLAMMYIIVYLGAVAVLFLFVVMMINIDEVRYQSGNRYPSSETFFGYFYNLFDRWFLPQLYSRSSFTTIKNLDFRTFGHFFYHIFSALFFLLFVSVVFIIIYSPLNFYDNLLNYQVAVDNNLFIKLHASNYLQNTAQIGELLYVEFGFLFILSSFILLIAMLGTIMLTLKKNVTVKKQSINRQVNKNLKNSISLYKIKHQIKE